jgi:hypothetical protein
MSRRSSLVLVALLAATACVAPEPRRPVSPAPPGPVDALRSLWGDYSGRCPASYSFCKGDSGSSICCPSGARCCEDADGPYCCAASHADRSWDGRYGDSRQSGGSSCHSSEITCSHGGRTICCPSTEGCCAGDSGPYCCGTSSYGYERTY